jgi:hypothetical protein
MTGRNLTVPNPTGLKLLGLKLPGLKLTGRAPKAVGTADAQIVRKTSVDAMRVAGASADLTAAASVTGAMAGAMMAWWASATTCRPSSRGHRRRAPKIESPKKRTRDLPPPLTGRWVLRR